MGQKRRAGPSSYLLYYSQSSLGECAELGLMLPFACRNVGEGKGEKLLSATNLMRWGGLAALVGGVLFVVAEVLGLPTLNVNSFSETATTASFAIQQLLFLLGVVFCAVGPLRALRPPVRGGRSLGANWVLGGLPRHSTYRRLYLG